MKSTKNKKFAIQLLLVGLIHLTFVGVMILGVSFASNRNAQKITPAVSEKPVIAKVMSSPPPTEGHPAAETENSLPPIFFKKAERLYHLIILQVAGRHQVDPALVKAIIMAESGYNPRAISKKGAKGLMQLMPGTAQALGVENIFNPEENISGGVRYFKQLMNKFGDVKLALAAYNAGSKKVRHYQGIPPFKATQYYIKKVFMYYQSYMNQPIGEMDTA